MPLIEWNDEFSTGIADVDYEHRELIGLINDLYATLSGDRSNEAVLAFLGEIYARISAHFALEEKIMRDQNYVEYEDHKQDHEQLLEEIRDIMDDYEDAVYFNDEAFAEQLTTWFTRHFSTKDARFHGRLI